MAWIHQHFKATKLLRNGKIFIPERCGVFWLTKSVIEKWALRRAKIFLIHGWENFIFSVLKRETRLTNTFYTHLHDYITHKNSSATPSQVATTKFTFTYAYYIFHLYIYILINCKLQQQQCINFFGIHRFIIIHILIWTRKTRFFPSVCRWDNENWIQLKMDKELQKFSYTQMWTNRVFFPASYFEHEVNMTFYLYLDEIKFCVKSC